ncbi:MAG: energy transducer TonB [Calditrichaeota bacterium]|nr:energy transducer TonB [Calditrichota bacterium]
MRIKKLPISSCSVILFMGLLWISCSESSTKLEVTLRPQLSNFTDSSLVPLPVPPYVVIIDDSAFFNQQIFTQLPSPVGGLEAIQANLHYPKTAQQTGLEAAVILHISLDEKGQIIACKALKTVEGYGFTEAAIAAVKSVPW